MTSGLRGRYKVRAAHPTGSLAATVSTRPVRLGAGRLSALFGSAGASAGWTSVLAVGRCGMGGGETAVVGRGAAGLAGAARAPVAFPPNSLE